nr:uncharacterized protein LOC113742788 [Coffea arabica]
MAHTCRGSGELICEELPAGMCALSVASSGKRCSLEAGDEPGLPQCKTSEISVHGIREHIETDECVAACGSDRNVTGISSDSLLDPIFTAKLCSKHCVNNCPNIVDLYSNLASAEGVLLSKLCKSLETSPRRAMSQLQSSGMAPSAPAGAGEGPISAAPAGPALSPTGSADAVTPAASPAPL